MADLGFDSRLRHEDFSGLSHTRDLEIGTPVANLSDTWRYRLIISWSGISILWLGEVESVICSFYLRLAARAIV